MTEEELVQVFSRLAAIEERNRRVELDKAWEMSRVRIFAVCVLTYLIVAVVFFVIAAPRPLVSAFIPTLGYLLSTQSLPALKRRWAAKRGGCN